MPMLSPLDLLETRGLPRRISLLSAIEAETLDRVDDEKISPRDANTTNLGPRRHSRSWNGSGVRRQRSTLTASCSDSASHIQSFSANTIAQATRLTSQIDHRSRGPAPAEHSLLRTWPSSAKSGTFGQKHHHHETYPGKQSIRRRSWTDVISMISHFLDTDLRHQQLLRETSSNTL